MNFRESLDYLDSLANLEKIRLLAGNRLLNLDRMRFLLDRFDHPEKSFIPVILVGTKGKGSTGFFLQSILNEAGIKTGFYSSPHLETPLERIRIGGSRISSRLWCRVFSRLQKTLERKPLPSRLGELTYFEAMTAAALLAFREARVRIGVLEAGLGGRLDAVNAVDAALVIVTTIGLDHEEFLGDTVEKIASEKAGVFRKGIPVISSPQKPAVKQVLRRHAEQLGAELTEVRPQTQFRPGLPGAFQKINSAAAMEAACYAARLAGKTLSPAVLRKGVQAADWPGRVEVFPGKPEIVLDAAHNPDSAEALTRAVLEMKPRRTCLLFGVSRDKNSRAMLKAMSRFARDVVLTRAGAARAKGPGELLAEAQPFFKRICPVTESPAEAFRLARKIAGPGGRVVAAGSFYLAGEIRPLLKRKT